MARKAAGYVDVFLIPVPKKNLKAYRVVAKKTAEIWMKYGALQYIENIGDDVPKGKITSLPKSVKLKAGEIVVFGCAFYKSRAHRDSVMKKVMQDEAMGKMWDDMPFDGMRMIWGGFKHLISK